MLLSRRAALLGLTSAVTLGRASLALAAAPTEKRLVVVILRGALDGLAAVVPYGDLAFATLRPGQPAPGAADGPLDLGGFFALHPALAACHDMYAAGELLPVHAVAGHYRSRSHFEAQDYLESGADQRLDSGWLNRVVASLPVSSSASAPALSVGVSLPLLLRGPAPVGAYMPQSFAQPQADLYDKLMALHASDPVTGPAIRQGLQERGFTLAQMTGAPAPDTPQAKYSAQALAAAAGRLLAAPDGPRIAAMELGGWDTHAGQAPRLVGPFKQLDASLAALKTNLGDAWRQTVVLVMTEFGRTVRLNGSGGTDHGTGSIALVAGGAVAGGRVLATWPGLSPGQLFENRDLAPTLDLRSVAKGLIGSHLGLTTPALLRVFPGSEGAAPVGRLLRT